MTWLRPTFRLRRTWPLPPVVVAVLEVDAAAGTALYAVLGCEATPARVGAEGLAELLRQQGEQL